MRTLSQLKHGDSFIFLKDSKFDNVELLRLIMEDSSLSSSSPAYIQLVSSGTLLKKIDNVSKDKRRVILIRTQERPFPY